MGGIETMEQHKLLTAGNKIAVPSTTEIMDSIKKYTPENTLSNDTRDFQNLLRFLNYGDYFGRLKADK